MCAQHAMMVALSQSDLDICQGRKGMSFQLLLSSWDGEKQACGVS